jgi:hypothetical protein
MEIVVENLHLVVVKVIFESNLSSVLFHYNEFMLSMMQVPIEMANLILVKECHGKYEAKLNTIPERHGLLPNMELVLMCLLPLVPIKKVLVELVQQLV